MKKGISITQDGIKIKSFFFNADKGEATNGIPEITGDKEGMSKDDWKMHFLERRKFLKDYTKNNIIPKLGDIETSLEKEGVEIIEDNTVESGQAPEQETPKQTVESTEMTAEQILKEINDIAINKLGAKTSEEVKVKSMEKTGLAFIEDNLMEILEELRKL